jgi:hypothetical protein
MKRFLVTITNQRAWYCYTLRDRYTGVVHNYNKPYNSAGAAKEGANLKIADLEAESVVEEYETGPEVVDVII